MSKKNKKAVETLAAEENKAGQAEVEEEKENDCGAQDNELSAAVKTVADAKKSELKNGVDYKNGVTCQICSSKNTYVYATKKPKRYMRCRHCGWTFIAVPK